jgi:excisionase family DNA binding protein
MRAQDDPLARGYLKARELAALLRVSPMTIYRLIHTGELEAIKVGRRYRIPESAARYYLATDQSDSGDAANPNVGTRPGVAARQAARDALSPRPRRSWNPAVPLPRSLMTDHSPTSASDNDDPPSLTLVLPPGLNAHESLHGLAEAVCRTRADMVRWLELFRQRARACAASSDKLGEARCRGQVLAAEHVIGHLDENIVEVFSLWDQYGQQIPGPAAAAPATDLAP